MSTVRERKVIDNNNYTREDAERFMGNYSIACSKQKGIEAKMEQEITKVREKYADQITTCAENKEEAFDRLQVFASTNPELFEVKKSMELSHGMLGFRTGTPKLKTLPKFTWDRVVDKLEEYLPEFVRVKKEADKARLLDSRKDADVAKLFKAIGIEVVQEESFFVEPKTEELA